MIEPINFEDESIEQYGVAKLEDFNWKQIMDAYACAECGRCRLPVRLILVENIFRQNILCIS